MQPGSGYKIVKLLNGVHSVHSLAHRETFHPVIGPVAEAEALYVRQLRLVERLEHHAGSFTIWDVGLGAAANALTVLRAERTRATAVRVRALMWRMTGASDGETLADVRQRPEAASPPMRELLSCLERAAFTYDDDLKAAIAAACDTLDWYLR